MYVILSNIPDNTCCRRCRGRLGNLQYLSQNIGWTNCCKQDWCEL